MTAPPAKLRRRGAHSAPAKKKTPVKVMAKAKTKAKAPAKAAAPADERIVARRVDVARRAGRRRLALVIAVMVVVALSAGGFAIAHSSLFAARTVRVIGAFHTGRAAVLAASGLGAHPPLVDIDQGADSAAIERLAWVARATVTVSFPSTVTVRVTERLPVAVVPLAGANEALVDDQGHVLADVRGDPGGVATITGVGHVPQPGGRLTAGAQALVTVAAAVPTGIAERVALVTQTKSSGIVIEMRNAPEAVFGTTSDLHEKFVALATVLSGVALTGIASIDLRAPSNPVLTP